MFPPGIDEINHHNGGGDEQQGGESHADHKRQHGQDFPSAKNRLRQHGLKHHHGSADLRLFDQALIHYLQRGFAPKVTGQYSNPNAEIRQPKEIRSPNRPPQRPINDSPSACSRRRHGADLVPNCRVPSASLPRRLLLFPLLKQIRPQCHAARFGFRSSGFFRISAFGLRIFPPHPASVRNR